jgi:hypothetical protein
MTKVEIARGLDMAEVGRLVGGGDAGIAVYTRLLSQSDWLKQFAIVATFTMLIALGWTANRETPRQQFDRAAS